jgi:cellobiose transport system substrate-binding protein
VLSRRDRPCRGTVGLTACGDGSDVLGRRLTGQIELTHRTFTEFGYEDLIKEYEGSTRTSRSPTTRPVRVAPTTRTAHEARGRLRPRGRRRDRGGPPVPTSWTSLSCSTTWPRSAPRTSSPTAGSTGSTTRARPRTARGSATAPTSARSPCATARTCSPGRAAGRPGGGQIAVRHLGLLLRRPVTSTSKTGKAWFDSDSQIFNAMQNQLPSRLHDQGRQARAWSPTRTSRTNWTRSPRPVASGPDGEARGVQPEWNTGSSRARSPRRPARRGCSA